MTKDVIALTPQMPDLPTLLAGLYAGGPDLGVNTTADGAVVQLCGPDGRPLVSVEAPILVQVPGETTRLLDHVVADGPVWWTARASTAVAEAGRLAGSSPESRPPCLGGTVWPPEAATTDVVPLTTDISAIPAPAIAAPAVDVLTDTTAVIIQDRPLIAMTSWLSDALGTAATAERALQIVTPPTTRLTLPTRNALRGLPNRWVVQDPEHGYYDGLSGAVLHWKNGTFTPVHDERGVTRVAEAFAPAPDTGDRQLILALRTRHPANENLVPGPRAVNGLSAPDRRTARGMEHRGADQPPLVHPPVDRPRPHPRSPAHLARRGRTPRSPRPRHRPCSPHTGRRRGGHHSRARLRR